MDEKPFKNREELKARIKLCGNWAAICGVLAFLFVIIGIIWRVFDVGYNLDSTFWFMLAIFFAVVSISPNIHLAVYRHLYGIESETKK